MTNLQKLSKLIRIAVMNGYERNLVTIEFGFQLSNYVTPKFDKQGNPKGSDYHYYMMYKDSFEFGRHLSHEWNKTDMYFSLDQIIFNFNKAKHKPFLEALFQELNNKHSRKQNIVLKNYSSLSYNMLINSFLFKEDDSIRLTSERLEHLFDVFKELIESDIDYSWDDLTQLTKQ